MTGGPNRASETVVTLSSSPSKARPLGKYGEMTQYWKSDFPHSATLSFMSDPKSAMFVMFLSSVYWKAIDFGNEVAGNVEWDGGSSVGDME